MGYDFHKPDISRHTKVALLVLALVFANIDAASQSSVNQSITGQTVISKYLAVQQRMDLSDEEKIKAAVDAYFTIHYEGQKLVEAQDFSILVEDNSLSWVKQEKDKREIELYIASLFDLAYQSYKFTLDYDSIEIKENQAVVQLRQSHQVIYEAVPPNYWAWQDIERLYNSGITAGCGTNPLIYCPNSTLTRAQMAVFLLRGIHGAAYSPPPVGSSAGFDDVPVTYWAAAWIKQFAAEGITSGCSYSPPLYCPEGITSQAQMAVFLLRSKYGRSYTPPPVGSNTGFNDVPVSHWAAAWIKQLKAEGITTGCGGGNFFPESNVTRAQMAGLFVRTFNLR